MDKKRKIQLAIVITITALLIGFIIYYVTSLTIDYVTASKNSSKIVNEFNELYESDEISLILFASPTCNFCKKFVPVLNEIKKEKKIDYYYLSVPDLTQDDLNEITSKIEVKISGIPHLVVLKEKKVIGEFSGYKDKETTIEFLEKTGVIKGDV